MIGTSFGIVAQVLDSAAAVRQAHATPVDSVVVHSPLPGGIAAVVRFLMNSVPSWVQVGGVFLGAIVFALVLWYLFKRRQAIRAWFVSRDRGVQITLAAIAVVVIVAIGGMGAATWNYTQHSNDFCVGCHIMNPAFQKFGDIGNKHDSLSCHACHQQSLYASARQVYMWVSERPDKIGKHAKVPNKVCESCHITGDTATWQRIAATAGHRVHLESDSSSLKNIQCVSCHGVELHRFKPVDQTCGESGCHKPSETTIVLGKMGKSNIEAVHYCISCHTFTAEVPALATRDSARGTLVPGKPECLSCHEMQKVMKEFDEGKDPHGGKCGTCHNPHVQKTVSAAATTCASAGCHANWRDEPFHVGASHRSVASQCLTCHEPHRARVDASNCEGCHLSVRARGKFRPPLPFDTAKALRRVGTTTESQPRRLETMTALRPAEAPYAESRQLVLTSFARSGGPSAEAADETTLFERDDAASRVNYAGAHPSRAPPAVADSFPHARHAKLACLECHVTGTGKGRLTFERPRGCAICHHQAASNARCESCHSARSYAAPRHVTMTVTVPGHAPSPRPVDFLHSMHSARKCMECHNTPVTLTPSPAKAQCRDCHEDHHAAARSCVGCHAITEPKAAHKTLETAHQRCDACHTATTIARLTPTRNFCSTCHTTKAKNHYDQKECSVCHFLAEPRAYQAKLITSASR